MLEIVHFVILAFLNLAFLNQLRYFINSSKIIILKKLFVKIIE